MLLFHKFILAISHKVRQMVNEGKLIVAGPLGKNDHSHRGIFILNVPYEEAPAVLQTDPAIHSGLLGYEIYKWYGSAALPVYLDVADKIRTKQP
jgi:uncharacterized protein